MSPAVVILEGEVDILARSGMWPGDVFKWRVFFVKATCSAFQPELKVKDKKGRLRALSVQKCPITKQNTALGTNRICG